MVLGRRVHRHPRLAALGSVSLAVAAHAACPVVVVPQAAEEPSGARPGRPAPEARRRAAGQVVVGVEDSPECVDAVGFAFGHAAARGLAVTAVHAWWLDPAVMTLSEGAEWAEVADDEQVVVDAILAPWVNRYPEVKVTRVVARDRPSDALVSAAEGAELLVVGSRGRGGFVGLLLGSVSREVLQHATCVVAVVRAGQLPVVDHLDVTVRS